MAHVPQEAKTGRNPREAAFCLRFGANEKIQNVWLEGRRYSRRVVGCNRHGFVFDTGGVESGSQDRLNWFW
jgi:hypothetical protein